MVYLTLCKMGYYYGFFNYVLLIFYCSSFKIHKISKLINLAVSDTIDERALNKKEKLNVYEKTENQNLCINAAKSIGCSVVNIGSQDLINGQPILVLGLIWQIVKIQLTATITLKHHTELIRLLEPGEDLADFLKLSPELILLRLNFFFLF